MPDPAPASPRRGGSPAIAPLGPFARAILRCRAADIAEVSDRLGLALPRQPCRSSRSAALSALWLGPDEWLLLAEATLAGDMADLAARLDRAVCSLVDVSHRQIALAIHGARAEDILSSGCALDLALPAFPVGMCTRTMFAKAEVVLWRKADGFHLEVWRSFARYVEALLREAQDEAWQ